jgi:transposase
MNAAVLRKENDSLRLQLKEKDSIIAEFEKVITERERVIAEHEKLIAEKTSLLIELKEKVAILEILHYGPKSEKWTADDNRQAKLFNEAEDDAFRQVDEKGDKSGVETKEVSGYTRRAHRNQGRKPISPDLPREDIVFDLEDDEKVCGCGHELVLIGEDVSERVQIKRAEVKVLREHRKKYACKKCEGTEDERSGVVTAEGTKHLLPGSLADESLLAWSIAEKFEFALPFYRQAKRLEYLGIPLPRATLCHHAIKAAEACQPLYEFLEDHIKRGPVINADETRLQVLKEAGRRAQEWSWMWVFAGGPPAKEAVLFRYDESRSHNIPLEFLKGYRGWLQTDDYAAYGTALRKIREADKDGVGTKHILCWAHARRGFVKAWDATKSPAAKEAIDFIREIFALEDLRKEYSVKGFAKQRANKAEGIFGRFKPWLVKLAAETPPGNLLGKAVAYAIDNWELLIRYVEDPLLTPSNNRAENAIRPFVVGRKNWLFAGTPAGAEASAIHYSLIESSKLAKLNPYEYLMYIFARLPYAKTRDDHAMLLPWNLTPDLIRGG